MDLRDLYVQCSPMMKQFGHAINASQQFDYVHIRDVPSFRTIDHATLFWPPNIVLLGKYTGLTKSAKAHLKMIGYPGTLWEADLEGDADEWFKHHNDIHANDDDYEVGLYKAIDDVAWEVDNMTKRRRIISLVSRLLSNGPQKATSVFWYTDHFGFNRRTVNRAKDTIAVKAFKQEGVPHGPWMWKLPETTEAQE